MFLTNLRRWFQKYSFFHPSLFIFRWRKFCISDKIRTMTKLYEKTTTLMSENIICIFSFYKPKCMDERVKYERVKDDWAAHTGVELRIFSEPLSFSSGSSRDVHGYMISRTPTQILVITSLSAFRLYIVCGHVSFKRIIHRMLVITLPSSMIPMQSTQHLCSVYLKYQVHIPAIFVSTVRLP